MSEVWAQSSTPAPTIPATATVSVTPTPTNLERLNAMETQVSELAEAIEAPRKDIWDIIESISGLVTGGVVAVALFLATQFYQNRQAVAQNRHDEQQLKISRIETVSGFMDYLQSKDKRTVAASIKAISALDADIAIELAKIFDFDGGVAALIDLASGEKGERATQANIALKSIFERLNRSVVLLSKDTTSENYRGVGFVVGTRGQIITLGFVVDTILGEARDQEGYIVTLDNSSQPFVVKHYSSPKELALVQADSLDLPALNIPTSIEAEFFMDVFALVPNPHGGMGWRATSGKIIELSKELSGQNYIVTDLAANTGAGGSPVVDKYGQVVGIIALKYNYNKKDADGIGLLPAKDILHFLEQHLR